MIETLRGYHTPVCDVCGATLPREADFHDAVDSMKAAGWLLLSPDDGVGDWWHLCPECREEAEQWK